MDESKLKVLLILCRSWRTDLTKGACCMVETSVKRPMTYTTPPGTPKIEHSSYGVITGVVLASRYFIEPCGSGRSRVMHLSRVDTKYVRNKIIIIGQITDKIAVLCYRTL